MSCHYKTFSLTLVRHATVNGPHALYGSQCDIACLPEQLQLLEPLSLHDATKFTQVYVSPLLRTRETCERLFLNAPIQPVIEPLIQEFNFGVLDGKPFSSYSPHDNQMLEAFNTDSVNFPLPQGETVTAFAKRIKNFLLELMLKAQVNDHLLLITHGGVIAQTLSLILNLPLAQLLITMPAAYTKATRIKLSIPSEANLASLTQPQGFFGQVANFNVSLKELN